MRVAILHFHLRAGGVTRVIEMACDALKERGHDPFVIVGQPPPAGCRIPAACVAVVPELQYGVESGKAGSLRAGVESAMQARWQGPADIIHTHNHSLGKNFALPLAVSQWADEGRALLLQIHDFAENGRPANYRQLLQQLGGSDGLSQVLYPIAPHVGYAMLNSLDQARLVRSGLASAQCWLLPNPVSLPLGGEPVRSRDLEAERLVVYPTRGIRRKNIGEALLWAAISEPGDKVVLPSAPQDGPDRLAYDRWKLAAREARLPVAFDAGNLLRRPSLDFLLGADLCLTTSVAEGFGMAFLEPWLAGKPLAGRDLPAVTQDFRFSGIDLDDLYLFLDIPADWIEADRLRDRVRATVKRSCAAYDTEFREEHFDGAMASVSRSGRIDFGRLDEPLQLEVIEGIVRGVFSREALSRQVLKSNPMAVADNARLIRSQYSLPAYGENLDGIYQTLGAGRVEKTGFIDAGKVLAAILRFDDFYLLRA